MVFGFSEKKGGEEDGSGTGMPREFCLIKLEKASNLAAAIWSLGAMKPLRVVALSVEVDWTSLMCKLTPSTIFRLSAAEGSAWK